MAYTHIFFGGIGTLVETSEYQLDAYNCAFDECAIDYHWSRKNYVDSLSGSGGQNRLQIITLPSGDKLTEEQIAKIHASKTSIFNDTIRNNGLDLRNGAGELFAAAKEEGVKLVWATTTKQENIDAIFDAVGDALSKDMFTYIANKDAIRAQKPDPAIYTQTLSKLGVHVQEAFAVEDSPSGIESASGADLYTIAFPGKMTEDKDFTKASKMISSLADIVPHLNGA